MTLAAKIVIGTNLSKAHLMEPTMNPIITTTITDDAIHQDRVNSLYRSKYQMHNLEQIDQADKCR
jgi:hypothetical protein